MDYFFNGKIKTISQHKKSFRTASLCATYFSKSGKVSKTPEILLRRVLASYHR